MRLFVDNLTNIDFSYLCPTRGLVGETWLASIELTGNLDLQGMVCDFGKVKHLLRHWLDTEIDHRLVVPVQNSQVRMTEQDSAFVTELSYPNGDTLWNLAPKQAITPVEASLITPSSLARWCIEQLHGHFGNSVTNIQLRFTPETIDSPFYHYSHGLKKHRGNCQRIAHGHRSKILIWRNGVVSESSMTDWAQKWADIYIGTRADVVAETADTLTFAYQADQGYFELRLPKARCYLIDTDTTVEYIAQHIANTLQEAHPTEDIVVKAFEGIGKGAIAQGTKT